MDRIRCGAEGCHGTLCVQEIRDGFSGNASFLSECDTCYYTEEFRGQMPTAQKDESAQSSVPPSLVSVAAFAKTAEVVTGPGGGGAAASGKSAAVSGDGDSKATPSFNSVPKAVDAAEPVTVAKGKAATLLKSANKFGILLASNAMREGIPLAKFQRALALSDIHLPASLIESGDFKQIQFAVADKTAREYVDLAWKDIKMNREKNKHGGMNRVVRNLPPNQFFFFFVLCYADISNSDGTTYPTYPKVASFDGAWQSAFNSRNGFVCFIDASDPKKGKDHCLVVVMFGRGTDVREINRGVSLFTSGASLMEGAGMREGLRIMNGLGATIADISSDADAQTPGVILKTMVEELKLSKAAAHYLCSNHFFKHFRDIYTAVKADKSIRATCESPEQAGGCACWVDAKTGEIEPNYRSCIRSTAFKTRARYTCTLPYPFNFC